MGVNEDAVEGDDKLLEQVPAYKPGWEVVFHFGDEELLAEGTACDGYGEIMQLEECGYAAISADGGQEWMSLLDEEGPSDEDINLVFFRRRFQVGRHLGALQAVTPLGVSIYHAPSCCCGPSWPAVVGESTCTACFQRQQRC